MRETLRTAPTSGTSGIRDRHVRQFETIGKGIHPEFFSRLKVNWPVCQLAGVSFRMQSSRHATSERLPAATHKLRCRNLVIASHARYFGVRSTARRALGWMTRLYYCKVLTTDQSAR